MEPLLTVKFFGGLTTIAEFVVTFAFTVVWLLDVLFTIGKNNDAFRHIPYSKIGNKGFEQWNLDVLRLQFWETIKLL